MCHLQPRPLEATLDVEPFVRFAAVQNALVAADIGGNEVKGLNDLQPELLPLLVLCYGDIFDVSDKPEIVDAGDGQSLFSWS